MVYTNHIHSQINDFIKTENEGDGVVSPMEKSREFICTVTSLFPPLNGGLRCEDTQQREVVV